MRRDTTILAMATLIILAVFASPGAIAAQGLHVKQVAIRGAANAKAMLYGGNGYDFLRAISCDKKGCRLYSRSGKSFTPEEDYLVIRTSTDGKALGARAYGGSSRDNLRTAIAAENSGALLLGQSSSLFDAHPQGRIAHKWPRPLLVRIDGQGKVLWAETMELSGPTWRLHLYHGVQTKDGGFILAGYYTDWTKQLSDQQKTCLANSLTGLNCDTRPDNPPKDAILIRLDKLGKLEWFKRYRLKRDQGDLFSKAWTVLPRAGQNFLVSLYDRTDVRIVLVAIDATGDPIRARALEGIGASGPSTFIALPTGGYLLVGRDYQSGAVAATIVGHFDQDNKLIGLRRYGWADFTPLQAVAAGRKHSYCVAGRMGTGLKSQAAALNFSTRSSDSRIISLAANTTTEFFDVTKTSDGSCLMAGSTMAVGKAAANILTYDWQPQSTGQAGPNAKSVDKAHMEKVKILAIEPTADELRALVKRIAPEKVHVTQIPVPASGPPADNEALQRQQ